ncbi:MAG TPA: hypothetical protein V6C81_00945 [Planktothrix sp.]
MARTVLFSDKTLAAYVNSNFEPAWKSVRPVPIVKIDFGYGTKITRTLHGNIASLVCNADGNILDILPGMYAPEPYIKKLDEIRVQTIGLRDLVKMREYHDKQILVLHEKGFFKVPDFSKALIERPVKEVILNQANIDTKNVQAFLNAEYPGLGNERDALKGLVTDTINNEAVRRRAIHERLLSGTTEPKDITSWLYKSVLHVDLDDPYLGLGPTLFATYPFKDDVPTTR